MRDRRGSSRTLASTRKGEQHEVPTSIGSADATPNFLSRPLSVYKRERDEQQLRADRLCDEAIAHIGYAPVSTPARNELKEAEAAVEAAVQHIYDDDT